MMPSTPRERDRDARHRLIIAVAREIAEAEGWHAVTTRRLAERIRFSQPVLYSHFRGKDEIVRAVALDGFAELTSHVREAAAAGPTHRRAVDAVIARYLAFAERHPAVYDAMFSISAGLPFADDATPEPLREAFAALLEILAPAADRSDPELLTEVVWASLHGLVSLTRSGRIPAERTSARIELLTDRLMGSRRESSRTSTSPDRWE